MCSDGERAWRGHTRCGGVGRGPAGGPGRWRGTSRGADVPETGLPAGRKWVKPRCRPGAAGLFFVGGAKGIRRASPKTGEGRENKDLRPFVSWEGNGEGAVSSWGICGMGGGPLGGDGWEGGRLPDWRTKSRALGRRGRPPLLFAEARPKRLRGEAVGSTS